MAEQIDSTVSMSNSKVLKNENKKQQIWKTRFKQDPRPQKSNQSEATLQKRQLPDLNQKVWGGREETSRPCQGRLQNLLPTGLVEGRNVRRRLLNLVANRSLNHQKRTGWSTLNTNIYSVRSEYREDVQQFSSHDQRSCSDLERVRHNITPPPLLQVCKKSNRGVVQEQLLFFFRVPKKTARRKKPDSTKTLL